jgi:phosphatidate cytidylyltransferase
MEPEMNNLILRIITALTLIPAILFLIFKAPIIGFIGFLIILIALALFEFLTLSNTTKIHKISIIIITFSLSFLMIKGLPVHHPALLALFPIATLWWLVNIWIIVNYPKYKPTSQWLIPNTVLLIIPLFGLFLLLLNQQKSLLLLLFLIVWGADSFAYFAGNIWGKNKLAPKVSGGKTIEGLIGGLLGAMFITLIWLYFNKITIDLYFNYLLLSIVTGLFSVAGDLYESIYKRQANVKDSGNLLPGHGGILDRIDGLLAATPIFIVSSFLLIT